MKQIVGVIELDDGHPVREDPLGTEAEIKAGPYLLSDGVSLVDPIPIKVVTGNSYVDSAGNLRGVWPMNISGLGPSGPVNITPPALTTETVYVGTTIGVSAGVWEGVPPIAYTYQWQMSNGSAFVDISGATASTYTATAGVVGYQLRVRVTATDANGSTVAFSSTTSSVTEPVVPLNTALPVITGTPLVGQVLSSTTGTWTGTPPPTFTRQWYRGGAAISGATGATYTLVAADAGIAISVRVTGTNLAGSATASSAATSQVGRPPVNTAIPVIVGTPAVGNTLTCNAGTWAGYPTPSTAAQWYRGANAIAGATAAGYQLVAADGGQTITCRVTATNVHGSATASSAGVVVPVVPNTWSPFTITAGNNVFGWGYAKEPIVSAPMGSISNEPYSSAELVGFFEAPDDSQVIVSFLGDVVDELDGYSFQINGTILPVVTPAAYNPVSNLTNFFIGAYYMIDGQTYNVERVSAAFDPLAFFEGTAYAGRLYDYKRSAMFTDAGVTPAVIGQPVYQIQDRTGGTPALQATSSARGILRANGIELDGLDDYYNTGFPLQNANTGPLTVLVVADFPAELPAALGVLTGYTNGGSATFRLEQNASGTGRVTVPGVSTLTGGASLAGGTHCIAATSNGAAAALDVAYFRDAVQIATVSGRSNGGPGTRAMFIGANNNGTPASFERATIRLAIYINRVLTTAQMQSILDYALGV